VRKEKRAIDPSQRKRKTEHRQLLSKPKQRSIFNKSTEKDTSQTTDSTHTHRPMWNEKEKTTTDKHTEANYNSRMYNTRKEKKRTS
jgi:hypothetical protein